MTTSNPQSETLEPKLEPCPWCGGPCTMTTGRSAARDAREFYNPSCDQCNYIFQDGYFNIEDAVRVWNTRVRDSTAATVDEEVGQDFTKHLMQRHQELALHVRQECAKVIELIEQYSRFDFYMWLTHDPSGLNSDPCKRAAEAKDILQRLIDSKPHERAAPSSVALRDETERAICANCAESIIREGYEWDHEYPHKPECPAAVPRLVPSPPPRELAQAAAEEIWKRIDSEKYLTLPNQFEIAAIILRICFNKKE